jgi:septation ring formation regulator EzrA
VHSVGRQVEQSTAAQTAASHAIAEAVRAMTERLRAVASASQSQHSERARIEHSLGTFQGASHTGVERARQIDSVAATLRARLAELERQLKAFRFD